MRGSSRVRHALRSWLPFREVPRVQEYANLGWLSDRLFQTPVPIAAGSLTSGGLPSLQFLLTEEIPDAELLHAFLARERAPSERERVLDDIAREVARMHALRFVHHDLFARNVLVGPAELLSRVFYLDAWAGGPAPQLRGAAYDLGCFLLDASPLLAESELGRFTDLYVEERAAQGRPVERERFFQRVATERSALSTRLRRAESAQP